MRLESGLSRRYIGHGERLCVLGPTAHESRGKRRASWVNEGKVGIAHAQRGGWVK